MSTYTGPNWVPHYFTVRASPVVLSMWLCEKIFFASKFRYVLFCNPTHKTETGRANRWVTTNSKPPGPINHYDGPIRNTEQQLDPIYYTLLCICTVLMSHLTRTPLSILTKDVILFYPTCCAFYQPWQQSMQLCGAKKPFSWAERA
jgi:hypothetical protein